ncbi:hypothetical protein [Nocardia sp. NPDC057227]|uniref:hypothetical protein n=1 Tax=Nocardia sp. NPDC057227 TaxID=3346056 RepID=UPI00362C3D37
MKIRRRIERDLHASPGRHRGPRETDRAAIVDTMQVGWVMLPGFAGDDDGPVIRTLVAGRERSQSTARLLQDSRHLRCVRKGMDHYADVLSASALYDFDSLSFRST